MRNYAAFKTSCYSILFFYPVLNLYLSFSDLALDAGTPNMLLSNIKIASRPSATEFQSEILVCGNVFFQTCFWLLISFEWFSGVGEN